MKIKILNSVLIVFTILFVVACSSDDIENKETPITLNYMLNNSWRVLTVKNDGITTTLENDKGYTMKFTVESKEMTLGGKVNSCLVDYTASDGGEISTSNMTCTKIAGAKELEGVYFSIMAGVKNFSGTEDKLVLKENNNSEVIFVKL